MGVVKKVEKLLRIKQDVGGQTPEINVINYLRMWNKKLQSDGFGNLYLINPGTPLVCAHMDTVQKKSDVDKIDTIRIRDKKIKGDNIIIGADDKAGVAIAMEMYEIFGDKISLLFTRQEETGCNGSRYFCNNHRDLLEQCTYCLVLDRKNRGDIIGYQNGFCSKEFDKALGDFMKDWQYKSVAGGISDTGNIGRIINAVNLSIGYYNLHTANEYLDVDEFEICTYAIADVLEHFEGANYPLYVEEPKPKKSTSRDRYSGGSNYSLFRDRISVYDYIESCGADKFKVKKDLCLYNNNKTYIIVKGEYSVEDMDMSGVNNLDYIDLL